MRAVDRQIQSHERALFGYTDNEALRYVPGLLQQMQDVNKDISDMKVTLQGVPETVALAKSIRKWGGFGSGVIILLLLAIVFHQYNLIPAILGLGTHP